MEHSLVSVSCFGTGWWPKGKPATQNLTPQQPSSFVRVMYRHDFSQLHIPPERRYLHETLRLQTQPHLNLQSVDTTSLQSESSGPAKASNLQISSKNYK